MTLKTSLYAFTSMAAAAFLAAACHEDDSEQLTRSNNSISFNVVKTWEEDVTRTASPWTPCKAEYMGCDTLVSDNKQDTLYLERTVSDLADESAAMLTRADILTASNLNNFGVSCVKRNTSTSATAYYFQNETASTSGSIYSTTNTYYWLRTGNENYDFYAYAPSDFTGVTNPVSPGAPTFTYDATTANCDLTVAKQTEPDDYEQPVPLTFDHLLSGIRFKVDNNCADIKISKIEIKGLNWSGTCNYNSSESKWEWSNLATNASKSIAREFSPSFDTSTNKIIDQLDASSNPTEASFFVVPQTIPAGATLELTFEDELGVVKTLSANISGELEQGKLTTYTLKVEDDTFDFDVEQEGLHLKITFTKGESQVTSLTPSIKFADDTQELISDHTFYGTSTTPSYTQLAGEGTVYYYDGSFFIANAVDRYNTLNGGDKYCWDSSKSIDENAAVKTQSYKVTLKNSSTGLSRTKTIDFHFDYFEYIYDNTSVGTTYVYSYLSDNRTGRGNFTIQDVTKSKWYNGGGGLYSDKQLSGSSQFTSGLETGEHRIRVYISSSDVNKIAHEIGNTNNFKKCLIKLTTPLVKVASGQICFDNSSNLNEVTPDLMAKQGTGLKDLSKCFINCTSLPSLNASKWNTSNVTNMSYMFSGCTALTNITLGGSFNTGKVTTMIYMFENCTSLPSLDVSGFNTENVEYMSYMFSDCQALTSLDVSGFNTAKVKNMRYMFNNCYKLTSLTLGGSFNTNTGNVTDMQYMFNNCFKLPSLNVSGFNTSNVTNMQYMFKGCYVLTSLNVSSFDTSNVTNMQYMFDGCMKLEFTSPNVRDFNTANVTNMRNMFEYCEVLTSLDVSNFNTANVTDMQYMFSQCNALQSLDVRNFNTANVTNMKHMFNWCESLTSLDVSSFNTSNVTDMSVMFYCCTGLTSITFGSNFTGAAADDMSYMFYNCKRLTTLDLKNCTNKATTKCDYMFAMPEDTRYNLQYLKIKKFIPLSYNYVEGMFRYFNNRYSCPIYCSSAFQKFVTAYAIFTQTKIPDRYSTTSDSRYWVLN